MNLEKENYERLWGNRANEKIFVEKGSRIDVAFGLLDKGDKLLDIGCGNGILCEMARSKYANVYGADISKNALGHIKEKSFTPILTNLNSMGLPFKNDVFDTVTCLDVIEHVLDPYLIVSEVWRVLRENGTFILITPNIGYIKHRISLLLGKFPTTSGDKELYDGGHLHYFTFSDIERLLHKFGFNIIEKKGVFGRNFLPQIFSGGIAIKAVKVRD